MSYCTVNEVKSAVDFPSTGAPITDEDIQLFIDQSEEEIESIYKTKFGCLEADGIATSGTTTTIVDTEQTYIPNLYVGYIAWIYEGTNAGEYREISSNNATTLTVSEAFSSAVDATSKFRIVKLGYKEETIDGSGYDYQFLDYQPIISLNSLTIDSTSVTPSKVYIYKDEGKLLLGTNSEVSYFANNLPQLINLKYVYGVYPLPKPIKRLCIVLSAMRTLTAQISGTYDDFTNISLPGGLTASKGEPYVNIQSAINYLQGEARGIIYGFQGGQVTADFRAQPSYRPFSLFG